MLKKVLYLIACAGLLLPVHAGDMAEPVKSGKFWTMKLKQPLADRDAVKVFGDMRFAPVDSTKIRVPKGGGLTLGKLSFGETLITWDEEKTVSSMQIMVYNKGDDGSIDREAFAAKVKATVTELNSIFGVEGKKRKTSKKDAGLKLDAMIWEWENGVILLEYAETASGKGRARTYTSEFIRLKFGPTVESLEAGGASDAARKSDLKENVRREEDRVWIEGIPMVDQGQKGYCVPATVARVFAYYGMDGVDQHSLAALAKSSGDQGTSPLYMQEVLEEIGRAFHFRVQTIDTEKSRQALIKKYNKAARRDGEGSITLQHIYSHSFDMDVMRSVLVERASDRKKWLAPIKKYIDAGIPVLWSVMLGKFPEKGIPQASGGHMRLIIGYSPDGEKIYYSDSWGSGHELKSMDTDKAALITTFRYALRPSR